LGEDWPLGAIVTLNVAYFALSLLVGMGSGGGLLSPGQTSLFLLGATGSYPIDSFGRYWTLLSASYLHSGILHLVFNLMALRQIGPLTSSEYGTSRMVAIYTLGGVSGYVASWLAGVPFTIGASAAVCGLIGAMLHFGRSRGGTYGNAIYRSVGGWVVSLFVFGLVFPGINNWGHAGGIAGGYLLGMILGYGDARRETPFHRLLAVLCALATLAALGKGIISVLGG
jgi:rhomboid protease GluP